MSHGDISGRAVTNPRNPSAFGVCDSCGEFYNLNQLRAQFDWAGDSLIDQGYLYCRRCLSKPQEQFRTPILPPDPIPRDNPRPEYPIINQNLYGFTQIVGPQGQVIQMPILAEFDPTEPIPLDPAPPYLFDDQGNQLFDDNGNPLITDPPYPAAQPGVGRNALLIALYDAGFPVPVLTDDAGNIMTDDYGNVLLKDGTFEGSGHIERAAVSQKIFAGYPLPILTTDDGRQVLTDDYGRALYQDGTDLTGCPVYVPTVADAYARANLLIYNPSALSLYMAQNRPPVLGINQESISLALRRFSSVPTNFEALTISVGTGQAMMQNIQQPSTPWQGSVWLTGVFPGSPFWAWEWPP